MAIGVYQRGMRHKTARPGLAQRGGAAEHPVILLGDVAQHHGQRRLVEILDVIGRDANAYSAAPVLDAGQFLGQMV